MRDDVVLIFFIALLSLCSACGGGGGGGTAASPTRTATPTATPSATPTPVPSSSNVQPIEVDAGPEGNYLNGPFTSISVCVPGTSECQTIENVLVDTGSYGLRILSSALTTSLPTQQSSNGNTVAECAFFVDSFTWGPVAAADVEISGEVAHNVPLQVIGVSGFPSPPSDCTATGTSPADSLAALGANGLLGIGPFVQDCGSACVSGSSSSAEYFSCSSSACSVSAESLTDQVQNPVPLFSSDNNGVVVSLPAIAADGAPTVAGSLTFGIGTESNNALGSAKVYTMDDLGNFTTVFGGASYSDSYIDSGTNGLYFLTSGVTGIAECSDEPSFYCPSTTQSLSAQNVGANGQSGTVTFNIANADSLFSTGNFAFDDIGGVNAGSFAWGLPFFFGREVFVAIDGQQTPGGVGPYWAY